jgi:ABC-type sugar transport system permease subunit
MFPSSFLYLEEGNWHMFKEVKKSDRVAMLVMLFPAVLVLLLVTAFPMMYVLYASFSKWNLTKNAYPVITGMQNYARLFTDAYFYESLGISCLFTGVTLVLEVILGIVVALLLFRSFWGRGVVRSAVLIPMMITPAVIGLIWRILLNPQFGIINYALSQFGIPGPLWLASSSMSLFSIIMVDVWEWTPFMTLSVLASLQSRSQDQVESALIDGANGLQIFRFITLPHIQPVLFIAGSFRLGALLRWFDTIYVMTAGGPGRSTTNLPMYIYQQGFFYLEMGYSSTIAVFLVALTISVTWGFVKRSHIEERTY